MSNHKFDESKASESPINEEPNDLIERFGATLKRANTRRAYLSDLRKLSSDESVSFENFEAYFSQRAIKKHFQEHASNLSSSTIRRRRATLRAFFNWLNTEFGKDLTAEFEALSVASEGFVYKRETKRILNDDDVTALLEATKHAGKAEIRDHSLIFVLHRCALRRSALASLDAESVMQETVLK